MTETIESCALGIAQEVARLRGVRSVPARKRWAEKHWATFSNDARRALMETGARQPDLEVALIAAAHKSIMPYPPYPPARPGVPRAGNFGGDNGCEGMSLRDWFAGMALQGLLACSVSWSDRYGQKIRSEEHYATVALQFADAMLEARKK